MLSRLVNTIAHLGGPSNFNAFVVDLHRRNGAAAPTRDEATRDYAAAVRVAMPWGRF